ncbi:uncharacterized protein LACBIDRAFT_326574 [Laccaria bicolor S238N-H82]|uniref:Predicted protein n=1 Tax=Laccaria bicolor (strain S238N-H82 / ATCC MYA-4686) TaxID=486041 RepID=B0D931_LACBS|nr:uncharacterized protein LACBIDRAFT_326574 [Laccaria bicolor S238N-H82]EDR08939.1 predicted protein [Laccaria bicolor S238N-H82]|eukprot:XP_001880252.1 predicted protein [Laccaria bicolor S238N-H82]
MWLFSCCQTLKTSPARTFPVPPTQSTQPILLKLRHATNNGTSLPPLRSTPTDHHARVPHANPLSCPNRLVALQQILRICVYAIGNCGRLMARCKNSNKEGVPCNFFRLQLTLVLRLDVGKGVLPHFVHGAFVGSTAASWPPSSSLPLAQESLPPHSPVAGPSKSTPPSTETINALPDARYASHMPAILTDQLRREQELLEDRRQRDAEHIQNEKRSKQSIVVYAWNQDASPLLSDCSKPDLPGPSSSSPLGFFPSLNLLTLLIVEGFKCMKPRHLVLGCTLMVDTPFNSMCSMYIY